MDKLNKGQKKLLYTGSKLPLFTFPQGFLIAFPDYFKERRLVVRDYISSKIKYAEFPYITYYRLRLLELLKEKFITIINTEFQNGGNGNIGINSSFKVTDKAWRLVGDEEIQERIHYNTITPTVTAHDFLVTKVLLTFYFERGFHLSRPARWRRLVNDRHCPLPDGVIESKFGEIWAIEVERRVNFKHLQGHVLYHGKGSRVIVVFDWLDRRLAGYMLYLLRQHQLKSWFYTSKRMFFNDGGIGPYFNLNENEHYLSDNGEMIPEQPSHQTKSADQVDKVIMLSDPLILPDHGFTTLSTLSPDRESL